MTSLTRAFTFWGWVFRGGLDGARHGPSLMAGGPEAAWRRAGSILETISARIGDEPCAGYLGGGGAGHFVKVVHNGIEYAIMQILADVFDLLSQGCGMAGEDIAETFDALNSGVTASFLVEASMRVVTIPDESGTGLLIDTIDDRAEQKGTGRWAVEAAFDFGVAVPTIAAAVQFRTLSEDRGRQKAKDGPAGGGASRSLVPDDVTPLLISAVACAMASAFQQGFALFDAVADHFGSALDKRRIASLWRSGCILRGGMVDLIEESQDGEGLRPLVADGQEALRSLSLAALSIGLPAPGLSTALGYVDALRRSPLSTRFIQMQRDYFGGHGFRRIGQDGLIHGPWHEEDET